MFTLNSGVTLILDENITLVGRSANNASLVFLRSGSSLIMNDKANIIGNNAGFNAGGGVYVSYSSIFTMNDGKIFGNTSMYERWVTNAGGGGVFVNGTFNMKGGEISGNTATNGGGVFVNNGIFTMSSGKIINNTATDAGGGVFVYDRAFTMNGGLISGNTSTSMGGGVFVNNPLGVGGTFTKSGGGTITGYNAINEPNGNIAGGGINGGNAIFYGSGMRSIDSTVGPTVNL